MLERILEITRERAAERQRRRPLGAVEREALDRPPARGFAAALIGAPGGLGLVAELKQASPSAGRLRDDFDVPGLAAAYAQGGASALSVLTEADHFMGRLEDLERASEVVSLPLLQKDFVLREYQVLEARAHGADAVLLIAEALPAERAAQLAGVALDLGMDILYEAHTPANVRRAASFAERTPDRVLVGVNNRDLRTFTTSIETSLAALRELPRGLRVVAESGIRTSTDLVLLRDAGACGVLVGEALLRAADVEAATRALLAGIREAAP